MPGDRVAKSAVPVEHSQERYTANEAIRVLETHRQSGADDPLFLSVSFDRPHPPLTPSGEYATMYDPASIDVGMPLSESERAGKPAHIRDLVDSHHAVPKLTVSNARSRLAHYYGLITHIDDEIGRILAALKEAELYDQTIIVFCSDHGDFAGDNGIVNKYSNRAYYDSIVRTPLLLKYPKQRHAGRTVDALVEAVDVFPTLCDLAGIASPDGPRASRCDGVSLHAYVEDEAPAVARYGNSAFSESYSIKMIRKDDYKLIVTWESDEWELYDLATDPLERRNLYDAGGPPGPPSGTVDAGAEQDPKLRAIRMDLKRELVRVFTPHVSESRRRYIERLFDDSETERIGAMRKLAKWAEGIIDGGGCWRVVDGEVRLTGIPGAATWTLERQVADGEIPKDHRRYEVFEDSEIEERLLDRLIRYLCRTTRPISLLADITYPWR
jgi:arylsulfatase A-like enzyme